MSRRSVDSLLKAIREGCKPAQWSRAVKAARAGKVHGLRERGDALGFRVETHPGLPAHTVTLNLVEDDWDCDCDARTDSCEHVAAAALVVKQARERGEPLTPPQAAAHHVGYRLRSRKGPIKLRRVLVGPDGEALMPASLAKLEAGRVPDAPRLTADKADRAFETRFGPAVKAKIPPRLMAEVLRYLEAVADLRLDGLDIEIGEPSPGLRLRVSETPRGEFVARVEQDPDISELFENGAFRRGRLLHAIRSHGLEPALFEQLRKGRVFSDAEVGELVGQIVPAVRKQLPVIVDTARLPGSVKVPPRIQLTSERRGEELDVLATLVYGDPPVARVDGDRLTLLSAGKRGARSLPVRNLRLETRLRQRLRSRFDLEPGVRRRLSATAAIELGRELASDDGGVELAGEAIDAFREVAPLEPRLVFSDDGEFELYFVPGGPEAEADAEAEAADDEGKAGDAFGSLDDDQHPLDRRGALMRARGRLRRADAAAVVRAWQSGSEHAELLGGGFGRIPADFMAHHGHLVADLLAAREAGQAAAAPPPATVFDLAELAGVLDQAPPPAFGRLAALVGDFAGIPPASLPEDLDAELRDYQRRGVDWLTFLRSAELGALLADDMGLGKTLQTLCVLPRGAPSLVVCPTSVLRNWQAEAERFRPGLRASVYHGPSRRLDETADLVLTTYAILRLDLERLRAREWDTVVLDEAQAIKNPTSKVARAAFGLPARFRIALTGTPVENHLEDLWSQFHFLQPGLLGGRSQFSERYVKAMSVGDGTAAARLRKRIRPFVLRRLKSEVARELPPRTDVVLRCELESKERQAYDAVRAATQDEIVGRLAAGASVLQVLEALLRLRQAACHPSLLPGGRGRAARAGLEPSQPSSKLALLVETLSEVLDEGHKALVFSQWTRLLDLLEPVLHGRAIPFTRLDGSTRDRQAVVDAFQDPAGPPVMLISLRAGGTGLNLTAADNVFLLDPWWNPAVEDQAADRAHRIGQDKPVLVHRLIASDTVEERILALQARKRRLAEAAVGDASGAHAVTREELLALLE